MTILTWNCNGALRRKFGFLTQFNADILIIQECENPAEIKDSEFKEWAGSYEWIGERKSCGLGIFVKNNHTISRLGWTDEYETRTVRLFLPVIIDESQLVLGVWTKQNNSPNFRYIGQFWKYLQLHKPRLTGAIIAGDFNSNARWDEWDRWWNHSDVIKELDEIGLISCYHAILNEEQGTETRNTFYLHRRVDKAYHIDYCFAPSTFIRTSSSITIGQYDRWIALSDHMPMVTSI